MSVDEGEVFHLGGDPQANQFRATLRGIMEAPASQAALRSVLNDTTHRNHKAIAKLVKKRPHVLLPLPDALPSAHVVELTVRYDEDGEASSEAQTPEPAPDEWRTRMRSLADRAARALATALNDPTHPDHKAVAKQAKRYPPELVRRAREVHLGPAVTDATETPKDRPKQDLAPDFDKSARSGRTSTRTGTRARGA